MIPSLKPSVRLVREREAPKTGAPLPDDGLGFLPDHLAVWARTVAGGTGVRPIDVVIEAVRSGYMWHRARQVSRETSGRQPGGNQPSAGTRAGRG